ncbi:MAG: hypothetical protein IZT55_05535 [Anaerolineae bacterium]|nr:hypothetical protein [Anaerolineae bacterium]
MKRQEVNEQGLIADLFTEDTIQPRKAIVMLGGSEGGKSWSRIKKPIALLVERGYAVLSLAYFKGQELPTTLQEIPIEYFKNTFQWLSRQKGISANNFAIIGGSKGAEAALLLGSILPQVKAVIAFSPSCVVWQGIPAKRFKIGEDVKSSWSLKGKSLPFLTYPPDVQKRDLLFLRLRKMHEQALLDAENFNKAAIQVEKMKGGVILISGDRDHLWPSTIMGEKIISRLRANEFEYPYEHVVYHTGHNGTIINKNCWRKIFNFLDANYS